MILIQIRRLAELPHRLPRDLPQHLAADLTHLLPLQEITRPVARLPKGARVPVVLVALLALVGGVRVLDALISGIDADPLPPIELSAAGQGSGAGFRVPNGTGSALEVQRQTPVPGFPGGAGVPGGTAEPVPTAILVEEIPAGDTHRFVMVEATGYTSEDDQTDSTPSLTARGRATRPGTLALSRDLLRTFSAGAPFDFGDRVLIPGMGIFIVDDTMAPRWTHKADIWFVDTPTARRWGRRSVYLTRVKADEPLLVSKWHP